MEPGANFPTMDVIYTMFAIGGVFVVVAAFVLKWAVKKGGCDLKKMGDNDWHFDYGSDDFGDSDDD